MQTRWLKLSKCNAHCGALPQFEMGLECDMHLHVSRICSPFGALYTRTIAIVQSDPLSLV